jgi:hypothetical protein
MDAFSIYLSYGIAGIVLCGASFFACSGSQTLSLVKITFTVCKIIVLDKLQKFFPPPPKNKLKPNLKPRIMATLPASNLNNKTLFPPLPSSPPESPPTDFNFKRPLDGSGGFSENELIELGQY